MDVFLYSFNTVMPLILIVVSGFMLKKIKLINAEFIRVANDFCFKFALPIQLFQNIRSSPFSQTFSLKLVLYICIGIVLLCALLCILVPRFIKDRGTCGSFIQGIFRSNFLLLGLPLAISMFGENNVASLSMVMPFVIILFNTLAVVTLTVFSDDADNRKPDFKKILTGILKNPLILASVAAVVFSVFTLPLPTFLDNSFTSVGKMATPLSLIILGGQFEPEKLKGNLSLCTAASLFKLILVPFVFVTGGIALGYKGAELGAILIVFCAPTAVSSYVMARSMHNNEVLAGQLVVFTTMLSSVTIFLWVYILRRFAYI